ncbi:MAG: hypothetical protein OXU45_09005 [Candidatus Melainabacteria bacterium]|nr:hypothetical protein [Candidatus Melainabacteria bacterium]
MTIGRLSGFGDGPQAPEANIKIDIDLDDVTVFANAKRIIDAGEDDPDRPALRALIDKLLKVMRLEERRDLALHLQERKSGPFRDYGEFSFCRVFSLDPPRLSEPVSPSFFVQLSGHDEGQVYVLINEAESLDGARLVKLNRGLLEQIKTSF